jgi:hypothetical protein
VSYEYEYDELQQRRIEDAAAAYVAVMVPVNEVLAEQSAPEPLVIRIAEAVMTGAREYAAKVPR